MAKESDSRSLDFIAKMIEMVPSNFRDEWFPVLFFLGILNRWSCVLCSVNQLNFWHQPLHSDHSTELVLLCSSRGPSCQLCWFSVVKIFYTNITHLVLYHVLLLGNGILGSMRKQRTTFM